jgi:hypothetical protein
VDHARDDTGTYAVHVYKLRASMACDAAPIRCDVPVAGTIDHALDSDTFHMPAVLEGDRVRVTLDKRTPSGPNFTPSWRLLTGSGTPASSCGAFATSAQRDCGPLPASGSPYQIEVIDHLHDDIGAYEVRMRFLNRDCTSPQPPPAPRLVIEAPTQGAVGLNVTFGWRIENPDPGVTYQFEVRLDKGVNACDNGVEEAFNAQAATCLPVALDPRRYGNQSADFAIRSIDSRGLSMCQVGPRLSINPQLPPNPPCP